MSYPELDIIASGIDLRRLCAYRLDRVRASLRAADIDALLLYDPINIRYALNSRNMLVWCLHNPVRYCFIPAEGKPVLFEFRNCEHLHADSVVDMELRPAIGWSYFVAGTQVDARVRAWAAEIGDLLRQTMGADARRLAVDRLDPPGVHALARHRIAILDGQKIMEEARSIKSADEMSCILYAMRVSDIGMQRLLDRLAPGVTENSLWATFHAANIEFGGDYIETRLLNSGRRTNPWFQECSAKPIDDGDLVCLDTDMVGPFGYCIDVSRTFHCGPSPPTQAQKAAYRLATEQVQHNMDLIRPGLSFHDYSRNAWPVPAEYYRQHYATVAHGIGMSYENPRIVYGEDWDGGGCEGEFKENMTLCVESYIGADGADFGVKFTEQVVVTSSGCTALSSFPKDPELSSG